MSFDRYDFSRMSAEEIGEIVDTAHAEVPNLRAKAAAWRSLRTLMSEQAPHLERFAGKLDADWRSVAGAKHNAATAKLVPQMNTLDVVAEHYAIGLDRTVAGIRTAKRQLDRIRAGKSDALDLYDSHPEKFDGYDPRDSRARPRKQDIVNMHDDQARVIMLGADREVRQAQRQHFGMPPMVYRGLSSQDVIEPHSSLGGDRSPDRRDGRGPASGTGGSGGRRHGPDAAAEPSATSDRPTLQAGGPPGAAITTPTPTPAPFDPARAPQPLGAVPAAFGGAASAAAPRPAGNPGVRAGVVPRATATRPPVLGNRGLAVPPKPGGAVPRIVGTRAPGGGPMRQPSGVVRPAKDPKQHRGLPRPRATTGGDCTQLADLIEAHRPKTVRPVFGHDRGARREPPKTETAARPPGLTGRWRPRPGAAPDFQESAPKPHPRGLTRFRHGIVTTRAGLAHEDLPDTMRPHLPGESDAAAVAAERTWQRTPPVPAVEPPPSGVVWGTRRPKPNPLDAFDEPAEAPRRRRPERPGENDPRSATGGLLDGIDLWGGRGLITGAKRKPDTPDRADRRIG